MRTYPNIDLANEVEKIQNRALSIIFPGLNYTNALNSGNIGPTSGREGVENQVMNALHKDS